MEFDLLDSLIAVHMAGSHAYGMNTEKSDIDIGGVCIPPKQYFVGFSKTFNQTENVEEVAKRFDIKSDQKVEGTIYGILKFIKLCSDCNPNMIERLFLDPSDYIFLTPEFERLIENRDLFLSKKARFTFSGYAFSQIKRIKTHRKWLLNPPEHKPTREEFDLPKVRSSQFDVAKTLIQNEIDHWAFHDLDLSPEVASAAKDKVKEQFAYILASLNLNLKPEDYDIEDEEILRKAAMEKIGFDENLTLMLEREYRYRNALTAFKQYENWKKNRNKDRAELEAKFGFDCYSDDTEFLTEFGWRTFDNIKGEKLATLNPKNHRIEYQNPIEKYEGLFTGNLYRLKAYHTDVFVTPNHKMYIQKEEKNTGKKHNWDLIEMCQSPDCFNVVNRINPKVRNFKKCEDVCGIDIRYYLKIMGWYISEGSVSKTRKNGKPSSLSISQLKGGRLHWKISRALHDYEKCGLKVNEYCYYRESKDRHEMTWTIPNREISEKISKECGIGSRNKKIPRWVFSLSKRMMEILLDSMISGDGTHSRPNDAMVYYTSSKQLSDDVQELAFLCGFETTKNGPYERTSEDGKVCHMYHIHINKNAVKHRKLTRKNISTEKVSSKRIVCFSVPNSILITRRNGQIGIHGNSKHGAHVVRLLRMGEEILRDGKVTVKRPDAEELLSIRNGAWTYDQMVEFADNMQEKLKDLYDKSSLRKSADIEKIDQVCMDIVERKIF